MPMPKDPKKRELCRRRMSEARKGKAPWNKGKKGKQVAWNKGLTKADPRVRKYSETQKGKIQSPETIRKISEIRKKQFQGPEGLRFRKASSEAVTKQWQDPEFRKQMEVMWADPDFKKQASEQMSAQNAKNWANPEFCEKMSKIRKEIWQNPKLRKHLSNIHKKRFEDPELRKLMGEKVRQAHKKNPEYRRRMSSATRKLWRDEEFIKKQMISRNLKPNKAERRLAVILEEILPSEYKYVGNFAFVLGGKCPDFMNINGQKKLLELYGNYWHNFERFPKGDLPSERIKHFRQFGFDTLVIWEKELEERKSLAKKIKNFHFGVVDA